MSRLITLLAPCIGEEIARDPIGSPDTVRVSLIKGRSILKPEGKAMQLLSILFKLTAIIMVTKKVLNLNFKNGNNIKFREDPRVACNRVKLTS